MTENPWLIVFAFWKKHSRLLGLVFIVVLVLTYIGLRLFITPRYLSEAILYPANIQSVSSEDPTEQALQILGSTDIKEKIIDSFNLTEHYGFNASKLNYTGLSKMYERLVQIERTPYSSIEISVSDKDPQIAADIANAHKKLLNRKILHMRREKFKEWANYSGEKYEKKLQTIEKTREALKELKRANGIVNLEEQSALVATQYTKTNAAFNDAKARLEYFENKKPQGYRDSINRYELLLSSVTKRKSDLDSSFKKMLIVGDQIRGLEENLALERETLSEYKMEFEEAEQNARRKITYSFEVSSASPSELPHYPKKVLTALATALSVTVLLILFLTVRMQWIQLNEKLK